MSQKVTCNVNHPPLGKNKNYENNVQFKLYFALRLCVIVCIEFNCK